MVGIYSSYHIHPDETQRDIEGFLDVDCPWVGIVRVESEETRFRGTGFFMKIEFGMETKYGFFHLPSCCLPEI